VLTYAYPTLFSSFFRKQGESLRAAGAGGAGDVDNRRARYSIALVVGGGGLWGREEEEGKSVHVGFADLLLSGVL